MFLQPIHPRIVAELNRREAIVSGKRTYIDPYGKINGENKKTGEISEKERVHFLTGKVPFVRMVSYAKILFPEKFYYDLSKKVRDLETLQNMIRLNHVLYGGEISFFKNFNDNIEFRDNAFLDQKGEGGAGILPSDWFMRGGTDAYIDYDFERIGLSSDGVTVDDDERPSYRGYRTTHNKDKSYRIMPGIEGVEIDNKGRFGSLREATVKFKVHTPFHLELYQLLYMTPGIHVSLEWGWGGFEIKELLPVHDFKKIKEILENGRFTKYAINNGGNYDALIGIVKNFSFARSGEVWDCSTTIISPGAAPLQFSRTESAAMRLLIDFFNNKPIGSSKTKITDVVAEAKKKTLDGSARYYVAEEEAFMGKIDGEIPLLLSKETKSIIKNSKVVAVTGNSSKIKFNERKNKNAEEPPPGIIEPSSAAKTFDGKIYVSVGMLEAVINSCLLLEGFPTAKMLLFKIEEYGDRNYIYPMFIRNHRRLISLNPGIMVLPGKKQALEQKDKKTKSRNYIKFPEEELNFDISKEQLKGIYEIPYFDGTRVRKYDPSEEIESKSYGCLRNILINVNAILQAFVGGMSLQNALKKIFFDISDCVPPGLWNFDVIIEDSDPNKFKVMEMNTVAFGKLTKREYYNSEFTFKTRMGNVKNINIDIHLPDSFTSGTFVSATSNNPNAILTIFRGSVDLIGSLREIDTPNDERLEKRINQILQAGVHETVEGLQSMINNLRELAEEIKTWNTNANIESGARKIEKEIRVLQEKIEKIKNSQEYIERQQRLEAMQIAVETGQEIDPSSLEDAKKYLSSLLFAEEIKSEKLMNCEKIGKLYPFDVEIEIDGIGGIYCGSRFFIKGLPSVYEEYTIFQVTGVRHSITNLDWKTIINAKMRPFYNSFKPSEKK